MKRYSIILIVIIAALCDVATVDVYAKKSKPKGSTEQSVKNKGGNRKSGKSSKKSVETSADVKRKQEQTQREIKEAQQQLKANEKDVKRNLAELGQLEGDIAAGRKVVSESGKRVGELSTQISELESKIAAQKGHLDKLRSEYLKAIKQMRLKRGGTSKLAFIFSSKNFSEALRRVRYIHEFSRWRERQSEEISKQISALQASAEELGAAKQEQGRVLASQQSAQNNLEKQYERKNEVVTELRKNGDALRNHIARKQAEANELKGRIASLIAQEQARAEAERKRKLAEEAAKKEQAQREAAQKETTKQENSVKEQPKSQKEQVKPKKEQAKPKKEQAKQKTGQTKSKKSESKPEKVEQPETPKKTSQTSNTDNGFASRRGALPRPVSGAWRVTGRFGRNSLPDMPEVVYDNPGIDVEVSKSATVQAVYAGKVTGVYEVPGYGKVVIVNHGDYYTVYGNLSSASVGVGQSVSAGAKVGSAGASDDDSSRGQLHFEVWHNREKLNPLNWIR